MAEHFSSQSWSSSDAAAILGEANMRRFHGRSSESPFGGQVSADSLSTMSR